MKINIEILRESNEFLNILLDNIETAVFIVDKKLKIYQFNDSFLSLFSKKSNLADLTFGSASGCINSIKENKPCGETSACKNCILKQSLLNTLLEGEPGGRQSLERVFYIDGVPVEKYLEFTSRQIMFNGREMILVFVYDITQIEQSKKVLKEKQKQLDMDLEKAGEIQKSLLPKQLPQIPEISAAWYFEPCLSVGGDIFQLYEENDSMVSMYMLDVCGHGVAAALIAVTVKQFLDQLHVQGMARNEYYQPAYILNELEKEFPFERFDCYFTIAYVQLNYKTGDVVYGCAGHVPPLILTRSGELSELDFHGTIIGLGQDPPLTQYNIRLSPGDKIILYTDGLIDYFGDKGDIVNKNNFYQALTSMSDKSVQKITDGVIEKQKALCDKINADDDISILIVEYTGP
jgi:sigma-B regulation protein RsbU (phosphoserine phosphatase)